MENEKKKALIISCILIVALSAIILVNYRVNIGNNNANFTINSDSKHGEFNTAIEIALADPNIREKVEFIERNYGEVTQEVEGCNDNKSIRCVIIFHLKVDKNKADRTEKKLFFFSHKPHGFSCTVNLRTKKVEDIMGWHFEEAMLLDIVLADQKARDKLETLKEKYGNVSIVYAIPSDKPDTIEIRFTPDFNPYKKRKEELYSILCVVDKKAKKVVKVEEFDSLSFIPVPTPPQNSLS